MTTLAPCRASSRTIAWPIPLLPPVTMATLPFNDIVNPHTLSIANKGGGPTGFEIALCVETAKDFDQRRHEPGPSGLMTGADAGAIVAVKIFVEQQVIPPIGIALELLGAAELWPPAGLVAEEDPGQPVGDLPGDVKQVLRVAGSSRALDSEV